MAVDLHLHTHHSDGTWSPAELVKHSIKLKLRHIAITDHDTVFGIDEARAQANGDLEVIPGVEINTCAETGQKNKKDIHILGYFFDHRDRKLLEVLSEQRNARLHHVQQLIRQLNEAGVGLTMAAIEQFSQGGAIGKAHLAKAMVSIGAATGITDAYERYLSKSSPFYIHRESVDPKTAVEAIVNAGGIASLAHPGKGEHIFALITQLQAFGLGGVEVYHRIHSVHTVQRLIRFANKNNLLMTGGSDCHGPYEGSPPSVGSIAVPLEVVSKLRFAAKVPAG
jgi:predicted metal-dependent phosphoesterase TrpH